LTHTSTRTAAAALLAVALILAGALSAPVAALSAEGSDPLADRVNLARQAAAVGAFDDAIRIYREVLEDDPRNERAFWGLVRAYTQAAMLEDGVIPLLTERISEFPDDVQARMELGEAHAALGNTELAHELWTGTLEIGAPDAARYADVWHAEMRHKMFEQARRTLMSGRDRFRNQTLFSQELTQLHILLGDYPDAIDECLNSVGGRRGVVPWATNQVELMLEQGASERMVVDRFEEVTRSADPTPEHLNLAGSVFLAVGMAERSLEAFLRSDEVSGGDGRELLEYAAILRDEGLLAESREAFLMVRDRHRGTAGAAQAGIAAAGVLADMGEPGASVLELREVAGEHPESPRGAQALLEAARLELDVLRDAGSSLATLTELRDRFGGRIRRINSEVTLLETEACVALGRFDEAYGRTEALLGADIEKEARHRALFLRGYVSFLRLDPERSMDELRVMVEDGPAGAHVNDALKLMLVMSEAGESGVVEPMELLASAHAARAAANSDEALRLLGELAERYPETAAGLEAMMELAEMAAESGDIGGALEHYARVIGATEAITLRAEAAMRRGDLLALDTGGSDEALREYAFIIEELPPNLLSGEARRKIDMLRRTEARR
jgi:tetratricopeptide (TPR) repeat protein